jgi:hypothetical protein
MMFERAPAPTSIVRLPREAHRPRAVSTVSGLAGSVIMRIAIVPRRAAAVHRVAGAALGVHSARHGSTHTGAGRITGRRGARGRAFAVHVPA